MNVQSSTQRLVKWLDDCDNKCPPINYITQVSIAFKSSLYINWTPPFVTKTSTPHSNDVICGWPLLWTRKMLFLSRNTKFYHFDLQGFEVLTQYYKSILLCDNQKTQFNKHYEMWDFYFNFHHSKFLYCCRLEIYFLRMYFETWDPLFLDLKKQICT